MITPGGAAGAPRTGLRLHHQELVAADHAVAVGVEAVEEAPAGAPLAAGQDAVAVPVGAAAGCAAARPLGAGEPAVPVAVQVVERLLPRVGAPVGAGGAVGPVPVVAVRAEVLVTADHAVAVAVGGVEGHA